MSSTGSSLGTSDIVGIVIGGVIVVATVLGLVFSFYTMCCKNKNQAQVWTQPEPGYPPNGRYGQPANTGYYPQQPPYQQPPYQQPPYQQLPYQQPPYNKQSTTNDRPPTYSAVYPGSNSYEKH